MSERITAKNIDEVIKRNKEIRGEIEHCVMIVKTTCNRMQVTSSPQLALQLLGTYGLIQMPVNNKYLSGAIYVKNDKKIPFINTAMPRANQYFTAWHELYHLIFDEISFDHLIEENTTLEERKAEYFASKMLLGNLMLYFVELPDDMGFLEKVFYCMSIFQTPYKAVLVALYEEAKQMGNANIMEQVKENFDIQFTNLSERFRALGLDDTLILPSNIVNVHTLQKKIHERIQKDSELRYHKDNKVFLENVLKEINLITGEINA